MKVFRTLDDVERAGLPDGLLRPITSLDFHCLNSGSGRLDLPYPGRLLICFTYVLLLNHGSEPG